MKYENNLLHVCKTHTSTMKNILSWYIKAIYVEVYMRARNDTYMK